MADYILVRVPYKPLSKFSPYRSYYFCSHCGKWIPKDKALRNSMGQPICPVCHKALRKRPRNNKKG